VELFLQRIFGDILREILVRCNISPHQELPVYAIGGCSRLAQKTANSAMYK
jgi:hypothetical protein